MILTAPDWTGPFEEELISMLESEYRQANFLIKCAKEAEAGPADGELIDAHSSAVKLAARIKKAMYKPKARGVASATRPDSNASSINVSDSNPDITAEFKQTKFDYGIAYPGGVKHDSVIVDEAYTAGAKWMFDRIATNVKCDFE